MVLSWFFKATNLNFPQKICINMLIFPSFWQNFALFFFSSLENILANWSWKKLLEKAGIPDLQIKDLRKFLNSVLVNDCGLSHKEARLHIGNTNMVNYNHYTQVDFESIKTKLEKNQDLLPQFLNWWMLLLFYYWPISLPLTVDLRSLI